MFTQRGSQIVWKGFNWKKMFHSAFCHQADVWTGRDGGLLPLDGNGSPPSGDLALDQNWWKLSKSWNSECLSERPIWRLHSRHLILEVTLSSMEPTAMAGFLYQLFLNIFIVGEGQGQERITWWVWALAESALFHPTSIPPDRIALLRAAYLAVHQTLCWKVQITIRAAAAVYHTWVIVQHYTWHLAPPPFPNQLVGPLHFITIIFLFINTALTRGILNLQTWKAIPE